LSCKVCGATTRVAFSHQVLAKYDCEYSYCNACGLLQASEPFWLTEAYESAIAAADTGLIQRNLSVSNTLSALLFFQFDRHGKFLDVAGGNGMLTRLMRDIGFDYYWSDKYCDNLLARGFEGTGGARYTAITAFEVLEHLPDPVTFIAQSMAMASTRTLIFSTELFSGCPPSPEAWWYYAFDTGQHISFYQRKTLQVIAERLGLRCYSSGSFHLLTDKKISAAGFWFLTHPRFSRALSMVPRRLMASKTMTDHLDIMGRP
jgi:Methyltransferase domain